MKVEITEYGYVNCDEDFGAEELEEVLRVCTRDMLPHKPDIFTVLMDKKIKILGGSHVVNVCIEFSEYGLYEVYSLRVGHAHCPYIISHFVHA